ncbi:MAG: tetratricopeptide repeat protein, partial [Planctomycetaceae bacterium]
MVSRLMRHVIAVSSLLVMMIASRAGALDTITRKSTDRRAAGEITSVSKSEVTVKPKVGSPTTVPANDIAGIEWDAEPAALGLARAKEASGQYTLAIADYEKALQESSAGKPQLKADIAFGIASATGKLALVEPEQREAAIARLNGFIDSHPDHYRHYDALLLLGQTYLNQENFAGAEGAFQRVMDSPWTDYRMAASVALGRTSLARGDAAGARAAFDRVATA